MHLVLRVTTIEHLKLPLKTGNYLLASSLVCSHCCNQVNNTKKKKIITLLLLQGNYPILTYIFGFCSDGGCSYVMASYARFLWDADDDEDLKESNDDNKGSQPRNISLDIGGAPPSPPRIAAAS